MKRTVYITLFAILGFMLATILHAIVEIPVILFVVNKNLLPLSFRQWVWIHNILSFALWAYGLWWGYKKGIYFWDYIYVKKKLKRKRQK